MRTPSFLEAAIMRRRLSASTSFVLGSAASGSACGRSRLTPPRSGARRWLLRNDGAQSRSGHRTVGRVETQPPSNPGRSKGPSSDSRSRPAGPRPRPRPPTPHPARPSRRPRRPSAPATQLARARRRRGHLVPPGHQLRHQTPPDDPGPACHEHSHNVILLIRYWLSSPRRDSPAARDMGDGPADVGCVGTSSNSTGNALISREACSSAVSGYAGQWSGSGLARPGLLDEDCPRGFRRATARALARTSSHGCVSCRAVERAVRPDGHLLAGHHWATRPRSLPQQVWLGRDDPWLARRPGSLRDRPFERCAAAGTRA